MEAQNAQIPEIPVPKPNSVADTVIVLGMLTGTCEVVTDAKGKNDCRKLLEPLEHGKKTPVDVLVDMLLQNPEEIDEATDRMNYLLQTATEKAMKIVEKEKAASAQK